MFKDVLLKDGINYVSMDDLKKVAKERNRLSSRRNFDKYRNEIEFAKKNFIQVGSNHKIYYSELVLDDYLYWLEENYGKKEKNGKDILPATVKTSQQLNEKPVITTQQIAEQLNTTKNVVLEYANKLFPSKEIKQGVVTYWTEEEVTLILEYAKTHPEDNRSKEMKEAVNNTETSLSSQLRVRNAIETMFRESDNLPEEKQGEFYDTIGSIMDNLINKARQASKELIERNKILEQQKLELENKTQYIDELEETLKFHHISDWLPWGKWKLANGIKRIPATEIFNEAGMIEGEGNDYLAVMFPNSTKPSIYINPKTAVPKLMIWIKNNPKKCVNRRG